MTTPPPDSCAANESRSGVGGTPQSAPKAEARFPRSPPHLDWGKLDRDGATLPDTVRERLRWYDSNARYQRKAFYASEITIILLSAAIPLSAALWENPKLGAVLGALVVVAGGIRHVYRWAENWVRSSLAFSALQSEAARWSEGLSPYDSPAAANRTLVDRAEAIVNAETSRWATTLKKDDPKPATSAQ